MSQKQKIYAFYWKTQQWDLGPAGNAVGVTLYLPLRIHQKT